MNIPVFDLHCDTVTELMGSKLDAKGNLRNNHLHIDLTRASEFDAYVQCFAFWSTTGLPLPKGVTVQDLFWREVSMLQDLLDKNSDLIRQARTGAEVIQNRNDGLMSAIFTLEGPAGIGFDPGKLEKLRNLGFCMSTLTWNESNVLAGSHKTGGGLTKQGREYVKEAQRLGILVDVSHISDEAFWGIIDMTQAPIVASHSNSRSVHDVSRNLTDDMFRAICQTGGVAGLNQYVHFLGDEQVNVDTACDHIFHFLELDPSGKHIALGADLDGCDTLPAGFDGIQSYPALTQRLIERGLTTQMLEDIFWNNAFEVINKCCM